MRTAGRFDLGPGASAGREPPRWTLAGAVPRYDDRDPPRVEQVIDLALCVVLAVAVVGLLLLAF